MLDEFHYIRQIDIPKYNITQSAKLFFSFDLNIYITPMYDVTVYMLSYFVGFWFVDIIIFNYKHILGSSCLYDFIIFVVIAFLFYNHLPTVKKIKKKSSYISHHYYITQLTWRSIKYQTALFLILFKI